MASQRGIALDEDPVLEVVKHEFRQNCTANNRVPGLDGFDIPAARRYCYRWLNRSHENRRLLDHQIRERLRNRLPADKGFDDYDEKLGYGYLIDGRRYSLYGDIIPLDAPPCLERNQKWNPQTKKWE